jgi:hypothetical protein
LIKFKDDNYFVIGLHNSYPCFFLPEMLRLTIYHRVEILKILGGMLRACEKRFGLGF